MVDFRVDRGSILPPLVLSTKDFERTLYPLVRIFAGSSLDRLGGQLFAINTEIDGHRLRAAVARYMAL